MTRWLAAAKSASPPPDKTDNTDETPLVSSRNEVLSVSSVLSEGGGTSFRRAGTHSSDLRRDLKLDPVPQPGDPEAYAEALRAHGPMSYGMAMRVLGWGGTRAGQAETALRAAGRITLNNPGRAVLTGAQS